MLQDKISEVILSLQRDLVLDSLKEKWIGKRDSNCGVNIESPQISLKNIGGAFICMSIALLLGIIILLLSLMIKSTQRESNLSIKRIKELENTVQQEDRQKANSSNQDNLRYRQVIFGQINPAFSKLEN